MPFFILAPNSRNKAIFQYKKVRALRIWSQILNILPYGALRVAKRHFLGIFGSKMAFLPMGTIFEYIFLSDSQCVATVTGLAVVLPFWLFLGIFWRFFYFGADSQK